MEKINEKRLVVLKVALECLLVIQKAMSENEYVLMRTSGDLEDLSTGAVKKLKSGEFLGFPESLINIVIYVISHLKKPFEETELSEELENLKKENIDFALDMILERLEKIKESETIYIQELSDYTRVLFHLERRMS